MIFMLKERIAAVAERDTAVAQLKEATDKHEETLSKYRQEFAKGELELAELEQQVAQLKEKGETADRLAAKVAELEQELGASRQYLQRNVGDYERLVEELNSKDALIENLRANVDEDKDKAALIEKLSETVHQLTAQVEGLVEALETKTNHAEGLVAREAELLKEIEAAREQHEAALLEREAKLVAHKAASKRSFELVGNAFSAAKELVEQLGCVVDQAEADAEEEQAPPKRVTPKKAPTPPQKRARVEPAKDESSDSSDSSDSDEEVIVLAKKAPVKKSPAKKKLTTTEYAGGSLVTGSRYKQPLRHLEGNADIELLQDEAIVLVHAHVKTDGTSWFTHAAQVLKHANVPIHAAFPQLCARIPECKAWAKVATVVLPSAENSRQLVELLRGNGVEARQAVPKGLLGKHGVKADKNAQIVIVGSRDGKMDIGAMLQSSAQMEAVLRGHPIMSIEDFLAHLVEYNCSRGLYNRDADMPDHRASFIDSTRGATSLFHWAAEPKPMMFQVHPANPADSATAKAQDAETHTVNLICKNGMPMCGTTRGLNFVAEAKSLSQLVRLVEKQLSPY
jgi:hypothetical protein